MFLLKVCFNLGADIHSGSSLSVEVSEPLPNPPQPSPVRPNDLRSSLTGEGAFLLPLRPAGAGEGDDHRSGVGGRYALKSRPCCQDIQTVQ